MSTLASWILIAALGAGGTAATETAAAAVPEVNPAETAGAAVPVIMVPGLSGCAYGWRKVSPLLREAGCRPLVIEPLGIGGAARPRDADYCLTAQADRLAARLDSLAAGPAVVVGHGVAASMALRLAWRRPDLVLGVVAIEGGAAESAASPSLVTTLSEARLAARLVGMGPVRDRLRRSLREASGDPSWVDGAAVRAYLAGPAADLGAAQRVLRAMAESVEPERLEPNLPRVGCPVVLLLGGAPHEGAPPRPQIESLRSALARLTVTEVAGAGHFIQEERPEAVVAAALALVRSPAGPDLAELAPAPAAPGAGPAVATAPAGDRAGR